MKLRSVIVMAAAAAMLATGCTTNEPEQTSDSPGTNTAGNTQNTGGTTSGDITVAVVSHGSAGDSFWDIVKSGAEAAGKQEGVKVTYNGDGDPGRQSQLIDNAIAQKVNGLVVSMSNPDGVKASVQKAVQAGIPVITINSGLERSKEFGAITHVGQSEELAGEAAGSKFKDAGGKKMLCVIHEAGNVGLEARCAGAKKAFGGTVENLQVDVSNAADAQATMKSKLLADQSVDAVLTLNPVIAKAAVQARSESKSKAQLATFDVSADIVSAVQKGDILFSIDQQPYLQGYLPVVFLALKARNGNDVGGGLPVYSGPGFITKENAAQVAAYAEKGTR